jgi:hypothetical protein
VSGVQESGDLLLPRGPAEREAVYEDDRLALAVVLVIDIFEPEFSFPTLM